MVMAMCAKCLEPFWGASRPDMVSSPIGTVVALSRCISRPGWLLMEVVSIVLHLSLIFPFTSSTAPGLELLRSMYTSRQSRCGSIQSAARFLKRHNTEFGVSRAPEPLVYLISQMYLRYIFSLQCMMEAQRLWRRWGGVQGIGDNILGCEGKA